MFSGKRESSQEKKNMQKKKKTLCKLSGQNNNNNIMCILKNLQKKVYDKAITFIPLVLTLLVETLVSNFIIVMHQNVRKERDLE